MKESATVTHSSTQTDASDDSSKTLLTAIDSWVMALPAQLLRDWTLAICAVCVAMQYFPVAAPRVQSTLTENRLAEISENQWRLVPARASKMPHGPSKKMVSELPLSTQGAGRSVGKVTRERVELEPTEFKGFEDIPGSHWVVQIAAFDSMVPLKVMVQRYQLSGAIGATTLVNGKEVHVLLMDVYPSKQQAVEASQKMPSGMAQINPWVRSVKSIRQKLK